MGAGSPTVPSPPDSNPGALPVDPSEVRDLKQMNATLTIAGPAAETDGSPSEDPGGSSAADEPGESTPPPSGSRTTVEVSDGTRLVDVEILRWLESRAEAAAAWLGLGGEVRARLIGDEEMSRRHLDHCGVAGTTDVITFDLGSVGSEVDVDLLVCVDEAGRQAAGRGTGLDRELLLYIVHGLLHCLGHDDHEEGEAAAMHRREDEILSAIGVGPVYGVASRDGADAS